MYEWFIFDLGNVLVKLAYERVLERICADTECSRDELVQLMEEPGGYRDLERGATEEEARKRLEAYPLRRVREVLDAEIQRRRAEQEAEKESDMDLTESDPGDE